MAREAGELLRSGREGMTAAVDTKTSPTDVVTAMDRAAERLVVDRLLAARPQDGVLGEEGADRPGTSGVRWVIDPIDGTVNYLYRLPIWSVSIAAEQDGRTVAGVVYDPTRDTLWSAARGQGAHRDGAPVRCSQESRLDRALVATGFGYTSQRRELQAEVVRHLLPRVRDIRRLGSAALDLCATAAGMVDAYYEQGLKPWDLAAAALIAEEAGCRVGGLAGQPASEELVVAAPPALFAALTDLLARLGADRMPPS